MKERLDNLIREEKEKRTEDADYFNSYKKMLQELLDEENERKKLGFFVKPFNNFMPSPMDFLDQ